MLNDVCSTSSSPEIFAAMPIPTPRNDDQATEIGELEDDDEYVESNILYMVNRGVERCVSS